MNGHILAPRDTSQVMNGMEQTERWLIGRMPELGEKNLERDSMCGMR